MIKGTLTSKTEYLEQSEVNFPLNTKLGEISVEYGRKWQVLKAITLMKLCLDDYWPFLPSKSNTCLSKHVHLVSFSTATRDFAGSLSKSPSCPT